MSTWDDKPNDYEHAARLIEAKDAEIANLREALSQIVALEPENKRLTQHEHYIAMLKALDIARTALANAEGK